MISFEQHLSGCLVFGLSFNSTFVSFCFSFAVLQKKERNVYDIFSVKNDVKSKCTSLHYIFFLHLSCQFRPSTYYHQPRTYTVTTHVCSPFISGNPATGCLPSCSHFLRMKTALIQAFLIILFCLFLYLVLFSCV